MSYYESHHNLFQMFAGYLNQDWKTIYIWNDEKPNYQSIVRKYKTENSSEEIEKTIIQLKNIMNTGKVHDEEEWLNILTYGGLGLGYYPPGLGQTYEEWLKDVLNILEEPAQETQNHFTPERI